MHGLQYLQCMCPGSLLFSCISSVTVHQPSQFQCPTFQLLFTLTNHVLKNSWFVELSLHLMYTSVIGDGATYFDHGQMTRLIPKPARDGRHTYEGVSTLNFADLKTLLSQCTWLVVVVGYRNQDSPIPTPRNANENSN